MKTRRPGSALVCTRSEHEGLYFILNHRVATRSLARRSGNVQDSDQSRASLLTVTSTLFSIAPQLSNEETTLLGEFESCLKGPAGSPRYFRQSKPTTDSTFLIRSVATTTE